MHYMKAKAVTDETMTVDTNTLADLLHCGRTTAVKIGTDAEARIQIGKRVLWNLSKIKSYVDAMSI